MLSLNKIPGNVRIVIQKFRKNIKGMLIVNTYGSDNSIDWKIPPDDEQMIYLDGLLGGFATAHHFSDEEVTIALKYCQERNYWRKDLNWQD